MALVVTSIYLWFLLALHLIPFGEMVLGQADIFMFQLEDLLHVAMFIPWTPIGTQWLLSLRRQSVCLSVAPDTCKPVPVGLLPLLTLVLVGMMTALGLEGLQLLLPYRCFNPLDGVFNLVGVLIGLPLVWISRRRGV